MNLINYFDGKLRRWEKEKKKLDFKKEVGEVMSVLEGAT